MAQLNTVELKVKLTKPDVIRYQLMTYCFLNGVMITDEELQYIVLLSIQGAQKLSTFCNSISDLGLSKTSQVARNWLLSSEKKGLVLKTGTKRKRTICVNPDLNLAIAGNILLDYKIAFIQDAAN